jgi:hypothetical protein
MTTLNEERLPVRSVLTLSICFGIVIVLMLYCFDSMLYIYGFDVPVWASQMNNVGSYAILSSYVGVFLGSFLGLLIGGIYCLGRSVKFFVALSPA